MAKPPVAGILAVVLMCLDPDVTFHGSLHYLLYSLSLAMQPRFLMTVDEDLQPVQVSVRVGQAVSSYIMGRATSPAVHVLLYILSLLSHFCLLLLPFLSSLRSCCPG